MDFEDYIKQGEPGKREKAYAWRAAIGLQKVDGLSTSEYLKDTAERHINGDIDIREAQSLIKNYYQSKTLRTPTDVGVEEADIVASHITELLSEMSFSFSFPGLLSVHRRLFEGVFKFAGKIRDYDITKSEWVLGGDTVTYVNAHDLHDTIEYDLGQEKKFNYQGLAMETIVNHITTFVSDLWQIHPFGEGNTRTTAVFMIKYLRSIGFKVENDLFAENSWYFRNALVRANYRNVAKGIEPDFVFLNRFFRNLLVGERHELKNRFMVVNPPEEWKGQAEKSNNVVKETENVVKDVVKEICSRISMNPLCTAESLAAELNRSSRQVQRIMKELKSDGVLVRIGGRKEGHWEITNNK